MGEEKGRDGLGCVCCRYGARSILEFLSLGLRGLWHEVVS